MPKDIKAEMAEAREKVKTFVKNFNEDGCWYEAGEMIISDCENTDCLDCLFNKILSTLAEKLNLYKRITTFNEYNPETGCFDTYSEFIPLSEILKEKE